jgi:exonuclease III
LKAPDEKFPADALRAAGYHAIWHGQKSWNGVAILARKREPREIRRGLPGDPDDSHSRYIEADVNGLTVSCLYLPNGNPAPGPKFDYKLRWFDRLGLPPRARLLRADLLGGDARECRDRRPALSRAALVGSVWNYAVSSILTCRPRRA